MRQREAHQILRRPRNLPWPWHHQTTSVELVLGPAPRGEALRGPTKEAEPSSAPSSGAAEEGAAAAPDPGATTHHPPGRVVRLLPSPFDAVTRSRRPSFRCSDDEDPQHSTDDTLPLGIELPETDD